MKKTTAYQREQAYEQELFAALKARTGKSEVLPNLTSSPKDSVAPAKAAPALKFEGSIEKVKTEAPAAVPTPAPAVPAPAAAPKPAAAPASAAAVAAPAGGTSFVISRN